MQWIIDNWVLLLLGGGVIALHLFGHGHGHGRGKHSGHSGAEDAPPASDAETPDKEN